MHVNHQSQIKSKKRKEKIVCSMPTSFVCALVFFGDVSNQRKQSSVFPICQATADETTVDITWNSYEDLEEIKNIDSNYEPS